MSADSTDFGVQRTWSNGHARAIRLARGGAGTYAEIARLLGKTYDTLLNWRHDDPEFDAALTEAIEAGAQAREDRALALVDRAVVRAHERLDGGEEVRAHELDAAYRTLRRRDPTWRDKSGVEVTGAEGGPVRIDLTTEDLRRVLSAAADRD